MQTGGSRWQRPSKFDHFLNRATVAAERSTCLRRRIGAIIVMDGVELSSGYVGAPRETEHCIDIGKCLRNELDILPGQRYELCRSVHAEQNAILNAARTGTSIVGGEMYISSERLPGPSARSSGQGDRVYGPCTICKKEIINVGLVGVHMREKGVGTRSFSLKDIVAMLREEEQRLRT